MTRIFNTYGPRMPKVPLREGLLRTIEYFDALPGNPAAPKLSQLHA